MDVREPEWRTVEQLALDMMLARDRGDGGRGRAVFLVGAGCSVSAGIPAAAGVSRQVVMHLAQTYLAEELKTLAPEPDADVLLAMLVDGKFVDRAKAYPGPTSRPDWGGLYQYLFAEHLKSPNQQRELIYELVEKAKKRLNWAHACLGELVNLRYVNTVLTTNFDQLVLAGIMRTGIIPVVADGFSSLNRIVADPVAPQLIHIHGSMNTYAMRNDPRSLAEPMRDYRAVTMLNGLLQRANILVVVGYAGGEEGLMDLLLQAADSLEQLVVYWVSYDGDVAAMSERCRLLLSGENKFAINGGEADFFFSQLMAQLKIGQPGWVEDPVGELRDHMAELVASPAVAEAALLIEAYREKIERAAHGARPPEDPLQAAARLRASGDFAAARAELEGVDLSRDHGAARLHASNALSLFEADGVGRLSMLDAALTEFEALVAVTQGVEGLENVLSLLDALYDVYDVGEGEAVTRALARMVELTTRWEEAATDPATRTRLVFYRAQARQRQAEAAGDDVDLMELAVQDFRAALVLSALAPDRSVAVNEIREGLAAALQVLAARGGGLRDAREAVDLFRVVVGHMRRDFTLPEDEGGQYYNLAGALIELMGHVAPDEAQDLREEARDALARAAQAYARAQDAGMTEAVARRIDLLDGRSDAEEKAE